VIRDPEVIEALARDPELLALADAIAATQPSSRVQLIGTTRRGRRPFFFSVLAASAAAAALALPAFGVTANSIAVLLHLQNATEPFYVFTSHLDQRVNWTEAKTIRGATSGTLVFHVSRIAVNGDQWRVTTSFTNQSRYSLSIVQPASVSTVAGPPDPGSGLGFSAGQSRSSGGVVVTSLAYRLATSFSPRVPSKLGPGRVWSGVFSGSGQLPRHRAISITWGQFHPLGTQLPAWQSWSYFSTHSFVLP
jgi:hypothetical protein